MLHLFDDVAVHFEEEDSNGELVDNYHLGRIEKMTCNDKDVFTL